MSAKGKRVNRKIDLERWSGTWLPCKEDVLPSAFEDKPLCVPGQLAELLQLSVEEVCRL